MTTYTSNPISASSRAEGMWRIIQRNPSEVVLIRNGVALDPQTVRIEVATGGSNVRSSISAVGVQSAIIYGVKDHPAVDVPDIDVQRLDRFILDGKEYTIETLITSQPGQVQAIGVVRA